MLLIFRIIFSVLLMMVVNPIKGINAQATTIDKVKVVATTTMIADLAQSIGGDLVEVEGLMGPGVDPHLYKASAGDLQKIQEANLIVYNGLHLESKMGDVFSMMSKQGKVTIAISEGLAQDQLIVDPETGEIDPHIWFDVMLWKAASHNMLAALIKVDPANRTTYEQNHQGLVQELDQLDLQVRKAIESIPQQSRVLVTAHDAFQYFSKAYGIEVLSIQGISTLAEAGTQKISQLAKEIADRKIKAIFVESSVSPKSLKALQEAAKALNYEVSLGGELYSDSLGSVGTSAETYIGTIKANVEVIVNALR